VPRTPYDSGAPVEITTPELDSAHDEFDLPSADDDLLAAFDASIRDIKSEMAP
jgi:hypothetical protein